MLSFGIVEHFDIIEDVIPSILAGRIGFPPDTLPFQQMEKAFSNSVVSRRYAPRQLRKHDSWLPSCDLLGTSATHSL